MSPRLAASAVASFVAALFVGVLLADVVKDDAKLVIPATEGDPIPLVVGAAAALPVDEPFAFPAVHEPVEVLGALEVVEGSPAPSGSGSDAPFGGDPPADPGFDFPVEEGPGGLLDGFFLDSGALDGHFDPAAERLRFLDFCADASDESCPLGFGATVLGTFGGGGDPGPFMLAEQLYPASVSWLRCDPGRLRTIETMLMVFTTHPALVEVTYYPVDDPAATQTVVVDTSDASHSEHVRFLTTLIDTGGPTTGRDRVQNCFVLTGEEASRRYLITAVATSYTGETATDTYSYTTPERRDRPPVVIAPLSDYEANVVIPVQGDGQHTSVLRVIDATEESPRCDEIERASVFVSGEGARRDVVPLPAAGFAPYSGYGGAEDIGEEIISRGDWPYDPAYDTYQFWNLNLREGRNYLVCIWWVRSPSRSFDAATVVEREAQWLSTPDRVTTRISLLGVRPPDAGVTANSIVINAPCVFVYLLPDRDLGRDDAVTYSAADAPVVCDYQGYVQPDVTTLRLHVGDGPEFEFAIPTPNRPTAYVSSVVTLDLSTRRGSGLCGSGFGSCDPPTSVYPGPQVVLLVEHFEGEVNHREDWERGSVFRPLTPPSVSTALPERVQLDWFNSGVDALGQYGLAVNAGFDRPVTLTARLYGADDDPCLAGTVLETTVVEPRTVHSLRFDGLCPLTGYAVDLTVTDAAGMVTEFVTNMRDGAWVWPGFGFTEGWPVRYIVGVSSRLVGDYYLRSFLVTVSGERFAMAPADRCLTGAQSLETLGDWPDVITVQVSVAFSNGRSTSEGCRGGIGTEWSGTVETTFTMEQFRTGPITFLVPVTESDGTGTIEAIIVTIHGRPSP